jgi:hypothetical protein
MPSVQLMGLSLYLVKLKTMKFQTTGLLIFKVLLTLEERKDLSLGDWQT